MVFEVACLIHGWMIAEWSQLPAKGQSRSSWKCSCCHFKFRLLFLFYTTCLLLLMQHPEALAHSALECRNRTWRNTMQNDAKWCREWRLTLEALDHLSQHFGLRLVATQAPVKCQPHAAWCCLGRGQEHKDFDLCLLDRVHSLSFWIAVAMDIARNFGRRRLRSAVSDLGRVRLSERGWHVR